MYTYNTTRMTHSDLSFISLSLEKCSIDITAADLVRLLAWFESIPNEEKDGVREIMLAIIELAPTTTAVRGESNRLQSAPIVIDYLLAGYSLVLDDLKALLWALFRGLYPVHFEYKITESRQKVLHDTYDYIQ